MPIFRDQVPYSEVNDDIARRIFSFLDKKTLAKIIPKVNKDWYQLSFEENYVKALQVAKTKQNKEEITRILILLGDYYGAHARYADATKLYCAALASHEQNNAAKQNAHQSINPFQLIPPRFTNNHLETCSRYLKQQVETIDNLPDLIKHRLQRVEMGLVHVLTGKNTLIIEEKINRENNKKLQKIKTYSKQRLTEITAIFSNNDENSLLERAKAINQLYQVIQEKLYGFLSALIHHCQKTLGDPLQPCRYAFITFGSLAKKRATPFSDLEWGILIEEGKDSDANINYFKKFAQLLEIKIIQLGYTSIPHNFFKLNHKTILLNLDDLIKPGLQFDLGGKTPLGRADKDYRLIQTPQQMLAYLSDEAFKKDKFLPVEIMHCQHWYGDINLTKDYQAKVQAYLTENVAGSLRYVSRALLLLLDGVQDLMPDLKKYMPILVGNTYEVASFQIKQEIYRLPDRLLEGLALYHGIITATSTWDMIDTLHKQQYLSKEAVFNLKIAEAIAAEIRLRSYLHYDCQYDRLPMLALSELENAAIQNILCLNNTNKLEDTLLFRFYYTILPLHSKLDNFLNGPNASLPHLKPFQNEVFFDNTPLIKGKVYVRLMRYQQAIDLIKSNTNRRYANLKNIKYNAMLDGWSILDLVSDLMLLVNCYNKLGYYVELQHCMRKILHIYDKSSWSILIPKTNKGEANLNEYADMLLKMKNHNLAAVFHNWGVSLINQYRYKKGIAKIEEALALYQFVYPQNEHMLVVDTRVTLGSAYLMQSEWDWVKNNFAEIEVNRQKASAYFDQALHIYRTFPITSVSTELATLLLNFASLNFVREDYHASAQQLHEALALAKYNPGKVHLITGMIYQSLGDAYQYINLEKMHSYFQKALAIFKRLSEAGIESKAQMALCLNNLGNILIKQKEYKNAENYLEQAKDIHQKILAQNSSFHAQASYVRVANNLIRAKLYRLHAFLKENKNEAIAPILIDILYIHQSIYPGYQERLQALLKKYTLNIKNYKLEIIYYKDDLLLELIEGLAANANKNGKLGAV